MLLLAVVSTCMLYLLSVVSLLPLLQMISVEAYPITSNPIEWTAENWAWQAWARQTSEEQSKGKGRKVTPKSIFEIPYRNGCPPGHHSDGKRCIPTVSIDPTELLNQQVLAFVDNVNIGGSIEFEYEDDAGSTISNDGLGFQTQFNIYDAPQKLSDEAPTNFDNTDKFPSQDAPLKFNFFEQALPTNENETMTFDSMPMEEFDLPAKPAESSNSTVTTNNKPANQTHSNSTTLNFTTVGNNATTNNIVLNTTLIESNNTINNDLLSESSNISAYMADKINVDDRTYFLSNIDAISLPAQISENKKPMQTMKNSHRVSIYKGDSALEDAVLAELYESEDLLPLGQMTDVDSSTSGTFQDDTAEKEKTDHIRSVSDSSLMAANDMEPQELDFTTTLEPDATTSFQLEETTIIEEYHPPTFVSKQEQIETEVNVEKLKVKPVQNVDNDYVMEEIITTTTAETMIEIETSTLPPLPKTPQEQHQSEIINEGVHINVDVNQFDYQLDMDNLMDMLPTTTDTTPTTTTEGSIDIISALNQDTTTATSETDRKYMNMLNNDRMVSTTTILQHSDKESLLDTKADVIVNDNKENVDGNADADTDGEIVFMFVNKQQTETTANNVMESLATTTQNSILNKENTITERTTSKRWSKVMPIFNISSKTTATTTTEKEHLIDETTTTTISTINVPTLTEVVTTKSSSISISEKRKSSNRRNSKIIRLDKYPIAAANVNILSEATKQNIIKTTTEIPITTTTESNSFIDPFWWLPLDWHLDRHEEAEGRPLLLRLWTSVTSDREAKV